MNIGGYGQGSVELLALRAKEQHQGGPPVPGGPTAANAGVTVHIYIYIGKSKIHFRWRSGYQLTRSGRFALQWRLGS
jgi:hypothetical protein